MTGCGDIDSWQYEACELRFFTEQQKSTIDCGTAGGQEWRFNVKTFLYLLQFLIIKIYK